MIFKSLLLAKKDTKLLIKDRSFLIILGIFVAMSIISFCIGYFTNHTIMDIYNATALELKALSQPVPPIPFQQEPLGIMKNMIIYIVLIGSLLAIAIGHIIGISDRLNFSWASPYRLLRYSFLQYCFLLLLAPYP